MHRIVIRSLLLAILVFATCIPTISHAASSQVSVGVSVSFGPPAIPVYEQPVCPGDGYIWVPGYWAWDADEDDYYWVPGTWVEPPEVGFLWTPGYWGWENDGYLWHDGYWGPEVGFYGGINYGFGYFGVGFVGGHWDHDRFFYNREVSNVNVTVVKNVYVQKVTVVNENRVSYVGGRGGLNTRPSSQEEAAARERHVEAVSAQQQQRQQARGNRDLFASSNHGKPPIAATDRPGAFSGHVVKAKDAGAPYNPPPNRGAARSAGNAPVENMNRPNNPPNNPSNNAPSNRIVHPKDIPPYEKPAAPNTGNPKLDQKYQQQQEKLAQQQAKEQQKLEQQQEREHQQMQKQQADQQRTQQMEMRHQQQTEQMQHRQEQQRQEMQKRQAPPPAERSAPEHSGSKQKETEH